MSSRTVIIMNSVKQVFGAETLKFCRDLLDDQPGNLFRLKTQVRSRDNPGLHLTAYTLKDDGATNNFISRAFINKNKLCTTKTGRFHKILEPSQNEKTTTAHESENIRLTMDIIDRNSKIFRTDQLYTVMELGSYDIILGKTWHDQYNPHMTYSQNKLVISSNQGFNYEIYGLPTHIRPIPAEENYLISMRECLNVERQQANIQLLLINHVEDSPDTPKAPLAVQELLSKYKKITEDLPPGLPPARTHDHQIETTSDETPNKPAYRLSFHESEELKKQLQDLIEKGWIRPSKSPYGSPVLFVKKKDGSMRLCVDYRALNRITKKNGYALPRIDDLLDRLCGAKYFSKLDLASGYNQIQVHPDSVEKTAFKTRYGHFEFLVMPFGLCNAPATFMKAMNDLFYDELDDYVIVYLDDILIFSKTEEDHLRHLKTVFKKLHDNNYYIKLKKCSFMVDTVEYLGFIIGKDGVSPMEQKISALRDWETPTKVRHIRSFMGLATFYARFIPRLATLAAPLTDLLRDDSNFVWSPQCQESFDKIKNAISSAPVLAHFNPDLTTETRVYSDASGFGLGAYVEQKQSDGTFHPIAFASRKLNKHEKNWPTHDAELMGMHFDGRQFTFFTDHASLTKLLTQPKLNQRQIRALELLQQYDYKVNYLEGAKNVVADALSRSPQFETNSMDITNTEVINDLISISQDTDLLERIQDAYLDDMNFREIYLSLSDPDRTRQVSSEGEQAALTKKFEHRYALRDGLLYYHDRLAIPRDIQKDILYEVHDANIGGHFGEKKTTALASKQFYWPNMSRSIDAYIKSCDTCRRTKKSTQAPQGLLQPLNIPTQCWQSIGMDFITGFPESQGFDAIFTIVDRLTKRAHFWPCKTTDTAESTAQLFMDRYYPLHGIPKDIVSDRGPTFTSEYWTRLWNRLKTKLKLSTAYHPQTDGLTERLNRVIEDYLRAYIQESDAHDWVTLLPLGEFAYNSSKSTSSKMTPFELDLGYNPATPTTLALPAQDANQENFQDIQDGNLQVARDALQRAQDQQQEQANKHRIDEEFQVDDLVYLSTRNLRTIPDGNQQAMRKKLQQHFVGPYRILKRIGRLAYELELPATMQIHPVVHVSLLKRKYPALPEHQRPEVPPPPVKIYNNQDAEYEVDRVLDHQKVGRGYRWLIGFTGYPDANARWYTTSAARHAQDLIEAYRRTHQI